MRQSGEKIGDLEIDNCDSHRKQRGKRRKTPMAGNRRNKRRLPMLRFLYEKLIQTDTRMHSEKQRQWRSNVKQQMLLKRLGSDTY